jgi:hypothetical protein
MHEIILGLHEGNVSHSNSLSPSLILLALVSQPSPPHRLESVQLDNENLENGDCLIVGKSGDIANNSGILAHAPENPMQTFVTSMLLRYFAPSRDASRMDEETEDAISESTNETHFLLSQLLDIDIVGQVLALLQVSLNSSSPTIWTMKAIPTDVVDIEIPMPSESNLVEEVIEERASEALEFENKIEAIEQNSNVPLILVVTDNDGVFSGIPPELQFNSEVQNTEVIEEELERPGVSAGDLFSALFPACQSQPLRHPSNEDDAFPSPLDFGSNSEPNVEEATPPVDSAEATSLVPSEGNLIHLNADELARDGNRLPPDIVEEEEGGSARRSKRIKSKLVSLAENERQRKKQKQDECVKRDAEAQRRRAFDAVNNDDAHERACIQAKERQLAQYRAKQYEVSHANIVGAQLFEQCSNLVDWLSMRDLCQLPEVCG